MIPHIGTLTKGMSITEFLGVKRWKKQALLAERAKKRIFTGRKDDKGKPIKRNVPLSKHR